MASGSSPRLHTPYPQTTDAANVAPDMAGIATGVLDKAVIFYQSASSVDTSVPTANPATAEGQIWWNANPTHPTHSYGLNYWDGSNWLAIPSAITASSTPSYSGIEGQLFYNTSTHVLYVWHASAWVSVSGIVAPGNLAGVSAANGNAANINDAGVSLPGNTNYQTVLTTSAFTGFNYYLVTAVCTFTNVRNAAASAVAGVDANDNNIFALTQIDNLYAGNTIPAMGVCQVNGIYVAASPAGSHAFRLRAHGDGGSGLTAGHMDFGNNNRTTVQTSINVVGIG